MSFPFFFSRIHHLHVAFFRVILQYFFPFSLHLFIFDYFRYSLGGASLVVSHASVEQQNGKVHHVEERNELAAARHGDSPS
jgi:hypothetical protein